MVNQKFDPGSNKNGSGVDLFFVFWAWSGLVYKMDWIGRYKVGFVLELDLVYDIKVWSVWFVVIIHKDQKCKSCKSRD